MYEFEKFVLKNGVRVILSTTDTREVGIWVFIKGGSQFEKKHESGISHFIEHLVFRGTKNYPSYRIITEKFKTISTSSKGYRAHTDLEETSYCISTVPKYFEVALDLISDLISTPLLRSEDIVKEIEIISQEIREGLDKPEEYIKYDLWQEVCFGDQPAGWPICGTEDTIRNFTADQIRKHFARTYVSERIIVSAAGNIKLGTAFSKIEKTFGEKIRPGKIEYSFPVKDHQKSPQSLVFYKDAQQTHFVLGVKTPFRLGDIESYASDILAEVLKFNIDLLLVGEKGIVYETVTRYQQDPTKSCISTYAGVGHSKVEEAISTVLQEYKKIREGRIETSGIREAVDSVIKRKRMELFKEPLVLARFFGLQELYTGEIIGVKEEFARYRSLKLKDIQGVAKVIFQKSNLNLTVIGPHPNQEKFGNLLKDF